MPDKYDCMVAYKTGQLQPKPASLRMVAREMKVFKIFVMHGSMLDIHCVYIQKVLREVICLCHANDELGPDNGFFLCMRCSCLKSRH